MPILLVESSCAVNRSSTKLELFNGLNLYDTGYFDYIAKRPELQEGFDEHMRAVSAEEDPVVAASLPLGNKKHCVDIGGGKGGLLRAVLDYHSHIRGGVFDLPSVANVELANLSKQYQDRFEIFTGSFFETLPFSSDALILKRILHDWDDAQCVNLLSCCREALSEDGELYIVESVLKGKVDAPLMRIFDLLLLTVFGGIERTSEAYEALLASAGLRLKQVISTETAMSILVASR
ncbi:MAG: Mitomycin biosynthesis 6-O-methyltransferase [Chlamydiales bacterium]|nr:Mitomycin biosynthesis 6-O-methyltransferase [Chlamydiales bacterium]